MAAELRRDSDYFLTDPCHTRTDLSYYLFHQGEKHALRPPHRETGESLNIADKVNANARRRETGATKTVTINVHEKCKRRLKMPRRHFWLMPSFGSIFFSLSDERVRGAFTDESRARSVRSGYTKLTMWHRDLFSSGTNEGGNIPV